jgi:putative ABC transport system permease protein
MLSDFRLACRNLLKSPGLFATAVLALGLGIGACTAMFSFVNKLVLEPLPFPRQQELVFMGEWSRQVPGMSVAYPNFLDWRERQSVFTTLGASRNQSFNYVGPTETERVPGAMLSHDLLPTLGITPRIGRWFKADEDQPGAGRTLLISERFWQRVFQGRTSVLGEKVTLSGELYTIIGVMPTAFEYPSATTDLWAPIGLFADGYKERGSHPGIYTVGRLKPGETLASATTAMKAIAEQLAREYPQSNSGNSVSTQLLVDRILGPTRVGLFAGLGGALGVLLIACANVANLLLARALARQKEFAVRAALGASRARLVRQLLVESLTLGLAGCVAGLITAYWMIDGIKSLVPAGVPRITFVSVDGTVLLFAVAIAVGTSLLFGLIPALTASRLNLNAVLSQGGRSGSSALGRWRASLIVGQFALTLVLLFSATLMIRTLQELYSADTGFARDRLLTWSWVMPGRAYADAAVRTRLLDGALEKLAALPGVDLAAITNPLPMSGNGRQNAFYVEGTSIPGFGELPSAEYNTASPDYFAAMGIPLVQGRGFSATDRTGSPKVLIIDTKFAEQHFKDANPLGRRINFGHPSSGTLVWYEIIGVVAHVQNYSLGEETRAQCYYHYAQQPPGDVTFVLKTTNEPNLLLPAVRTTMREVDPTLPIFAVRTMREVFENTVGYQRALLITLGIMSTTALSLAAIGIYGVLSYLVGQRTREIGVRMALGATPRSVLGLMLSSGLRLAAVGLALGVLLALGSGRLLGSLLYGVSPYDPIALIGVPFVLLLIGLAACFLPAWQATRVNPTEALRAD